MEQVWINKAQRTNQSGRGSCVTMSPGPLGAHNAVIVLAWLRRLAGGTDTLIIRTNATGWQTP